MQLPTITQLADRAARDAGPDRVLDGLVFRVVNDREGDVWHDGFDEGVWYRRDPEDHCAFDGPEPVSGSVDAAMATLVPGMRLTHLGHHPQNGPEALLDADRPWQASVTIDAFDETFVERAPDAARAVLAASMRAHSRLSDR